MDTLIYAAGAVIVLMLAYVAWQLTRLSRGQGDSANAAELSALREAERAKAIELSALTVRLAERDADLASRERDLSRLAQECGEAQARAERHGTAAAELNANLRARDTELADLRARLDAERGELSHLRAELALQRERSAQTEANLAHAEQAKAEIKGFLESAQTKLSATFAELAGKTFEERGAQFENNVRTATQQSRTDFETLLKPFANQLNEFRTRVDTVYGEEAKERASLAGAVNELKTLNQDMAAQASALTRALKGSAKVRGDWGELMLESVLRSSGLEDGTHYDRQASSEDDEGRRLRPDVVVRLPGDRRIVVDSKVNLIDWEQAMNAQTPEEHEDALRRHAVALRQHMKDLADKNYPKAVGDSALEVTVAFVPIEGALSAALGTDPALQTDAFARGIVFASPNTLMAVLRVIERLWTRDKIQRQAIDISDAGGRVLDALQNFLTEFDQVGRKLNEANTSFVNARNKLSESTHAVIPRARRLVELGVKGKKALSAELAPDEQVLPLTLERSGSGD
ncbi:DNA recombination protein RmuC [Lysobacter sp. MMG2]|uniref:DNA recombination protein RmuC n=1 Tax=Lysobacter sp. MMG2 TaxID=2801338 RepID=UPI001C24AB1A|nr:DNA recombination protein RmuC [Lysobacter sp. MMG2]MBU8977126.1 DNA recombination protein RmuC [Lysobacter sp. MMG2]